MVRPRGPTLELGRRSRPGLGSPGLAPPPAPITPATASTQAFNHRPLPGTAIFPHPSTASPQPRRQGLAHELPEAVNEGVDQGGLGLSHAVHGQPRSH